MNNGGLSKDNSGLTQTMAGLTNPEIAEQCQINADNGRIIENNGRLTNPEIATAGLALRKLGQEDHHRTILYVKP